MSVDSVPSRDPKDSGSKKRELEFRERKNIQPRVCQRAFGLCLIDKVRRETCKIARSMERARAMAYVNREGEKTKGWRVGSFEIRNCSSLRERRGDDVSKRASEASATTGPPAASPVSSV